MIQAARAGGVGSTARFGPPRNLQVSNIAGDCLLCGDEGARQDSVFIKKDQLVRRWSNLGRCCKSRKRHDLSKMGSTTRVPAPTYWPSRKGRFLPWEKESYQPYPRLCAGMPDLKAGLHTRYCGITECAVEGRYLHDPSSAPTSCIADDVHRPVSKISCRNPFLASPLVAWHPSISPTKEPSKNQTSRPIQARASQASIATTPSHQVFSCTSSDLL